MRLNTRWYLSSLLSTTALIFVTSAVAQQKTTTQANTRYDASKESVVQGTVVSYSATSNVPPIGPYAKVQTSSGVVNVHLGNAQVLKQNDIVLAAGDSVSIVGENLQFGSGVVFAARVLRKGSQTVTLRSVTGIPMLGKPAANAKPRSIFGGAQ